MIKAKDDHHEVAFAYSSTGRLLSREENGTKLNFRYDRLDQLQAIENEHKSIYLFKRDPTGAIIEESGYDGLKRKYQRDAGGRISQIYNPDQSQTPSLTKQEMQHIKSLRT